MTIQHTAPEKHKRNKEHRRAALIEAAQCVFAERGYDAATTREIAERAACAEGLIHRYFEGKHGLLLAIMESKAARLADELRNTLPDRDTVEEEIEQALHHELDHMWEYRDFMRVGVCQAIINPSIGRTINDTVNRARLDIFIEKLRRHQQAGRIRPDADLEAVAYAIAGICFSTGFFLQIVFGCDRAFARRLAQSAVQTICHGITPPADGGERPQ